ncbi:hypothetical protein CDES_13545 [Corynebacterium deserti GIMN1.010]|uniref:PRD domain-containing protein n=1 Tax=Corynebacterium deserti GIMN1.010 TaxID=931089 RepID=A0A0M3QA83_9CORY|nr:PRD domain-containing protein [Corynebacterium deserti]ALC07039.1 hypothetical protein CDES_13545 [Corynebacterium deserti GIMN1.010]
MSHSQSNSQLSAVVQLLITEGDFLRAAHVAQHLGVSTKTVYRLIEGAKKDPSLSNIIESQRGLGFRIAPGRFEDALELTQGSAPLTEPVKNDFSTPDARRRSILVKLLLHSPGSVSIADILSEFYISEFTLRSDEPHLKNWCDGFDLTLSRKSATMSVSGSEQSIRLALSDAFSAASEKPFLAATSLGDERILSTVERAVAHIEEDLNATIPQPYRMNLESHLYIVLLRARRPTLNATSRELGTGPDPEAPFTQVSLNALRELQKLSHLNLHISEAEYIRRYLVSSRTIGGHNTPVEVAPSGQRSEGLQVTDRFIDLVAEKVPGPFHSEKLRQDLADHITPMLNRLHFEVVVKNPLISQIQKEYREVYLAVTAAAPIIADEFNLPPISDHESGYISLYFAREKETHRRPIKTAVMCASGFGVSELLRVKLENRFPDLDIQGVYGLEDYPARIPDGIELIVSSVGVARQPQAFARVILVDSMLSKESERNVRDCIRNLR